MYLIQNAKRKSSANVERAKGKRVWCYIVHSIVDHGPITNENRKIYVLTVGSQFCSRVSYL